MTTQTGRRCLKCHHVNPAATMAADEACPQCGAIYSRVEAFVKSKAGAATAAPSPFSNAAPAMRHSTFGTPVAPGAAQNIAEFVQTLRAGSLYPTFRGLVRLVTWGWYLLALTSLIVPFVKPLDGSAKIMGVILSVFIVVMATAAREAALMLADLSDAAVITAAQASRDKTP